MMKKQLAALLSAAMVLTAVPAVPVSADEVQDAAAAESVQEEAAETEDTAGETAPEESSEEEAEPDQREDLEEKIENTAEEEMPAEDESEKPEEQKEEPSVKAVLSEDEKVITVTATGIDTSATEVLFPTWSDAKGQDDIEWAAGKKQPDGSWTVSVKVRKHKDTGRYLIHCYQTIDGKMNYFGKTEVTVTAPSGTVKTENLDAANGTFTVRLTDLTVPSGIEKVQIPVWGAVDDQNDIVWYDAVKDGEDYVVQVDAASHSYENGLYHIHCYVTDGNGFTGFAGRTTAEIAMESGVTAELSEDETTIRVTARGINADATAVQFPTWSEKNAQDDLKWVKAKKAAATVWTADIPVKGHKDTGIYQIHCYQTVKGKQKFFGKAQVTVTAPSGTVTASEPDQKTGAFEAQISSLKVPAGVKQIQFAVWGEPDSQNDIVWHNAVKKGDAYTVSVTPGEHKFETGRYFVHCYITDKNDIMSFAGSTEVQVSMQEGVSAAVASDEKTVEIQYVGPKAGGALKAAVWSAEGGQDDLVWYDLKQNGNGASGKAVINKHKTAGEYFVHVYTGSNTFVGNTGFTLGGVSSAKVTVSAVNGQKGTFKVTVSGISSPSGISKVMVPVWPNGDQSKIYWYTASVSGDSYTCTVNVSRHSRAFGHYTIHVYGYAENGIVGFAGNAETDLNADRYVYAEKTGTYTTRVWLLNAGSDASGASFKAWSNTNGQDDLVTYTGTRSGSSDFYADVQSKKHKNGGNYTTEAYVKTSAGSTLAGTVTYSMAKEGEAKNKSMYQLAQGFASDTNYLILVNRGIHRVAIYQGSQNNWKEIKYWPCVVGKPSTPTPTGTYKIKGRFDWFGSDHKCWWATQIQGYYYFHTVLYYWGDAPTKILDGTMDAAASMGCIRLEEPNARWIYTTIPRGTTVHIYN